MTTNSEESAEPRQATLTFADRVRHRARIDPARFFVDKDRLARTSLQVALGSLVCAVVGMALLGWSLTRPMMIAVMDASGGVVIQPIKGFPESRGLHIEQALLATTALFSRNPKGFDMPELLEAMFFRSAQNQALALKSSESAEFLDKHIQQKPQIYKIDALETRPDSVRVLVTGDLIRAGVFHDQAIYEVIPFTLTLSLKLNPDLLRNRHQPTLVASFDLKYEKTP